MSRVKHQNPPPIRQRRTIHRLNSTTFRILLAHITGEVEVAKVKPATDPRLVALVTNTPPGPRQTDRKQDKII